MDIFPCGDIECDSQKLLPTLLLDRLSSPISKADFTILHFMNVRPGQTAPSFSTYRRFTRDSQSISSTMSLSDLPFDISSTVSLSDLPYDIHACLLPFLDFTSLCNLIKTNHYFRALPTLTTFKRALLAAETSRTRFTKEVRTWGPPPECAPTRKRVRVYACHTCCQLQVGYWFGGDYHPSVLKVNPLRTCMSCATHRRALREERQEEEEKSRRLARQEAQMEVRPSHHMCWPPWVLRADRCHEGNTRGNDGTTLIKSDLEIMSFLDDGFLPEVAVACHRIQPVTSDQHLWNALSPSRHIHILLQPQVWTGVFCFYSRAPSFYLMHQRLSSHNTKRSQLRSVRRCQDKVYISTASAAWSA